MIGTRLKAYAAVSYGGELRQVRVCGGGGIEAHTEGPLMIH